ncbi:MAG: adenylate/guanylate cyclase domain-containing protein [Dehalococcoidia bacterium]|nr:adenylate/guanylate cyclase domain-containing protein [Dehalococcoidia bacterium]
MKNNAATPGPKSRKKTKRLYHTLALLSVGCLFTLVVILIQPFRSTNFWLADQLFESETPSPNIVVAGIDDTTLETYGRWSEWPRSLHAQAIDNLSAAKAKVIAYDVLFFDDSVDDQVLAEAMAEAGNVVLAMSGSVRIPDTKSVVTYRQMERPTALLEQAMSGAGHANMNPDRDGKVRRIEMVIRDSAGNAYPAFSLSILHTLFSMPLPQEYPIQGHELHVVNREIPVDSSYDLRVNFSADTSQLAYISYGDIISGNFDPSIVKGKIVLIGMTATGDVDVWAVPTKNGKIPGTFIHALAIDTILRERYLTEAGTGTTLLTLLILVGITGLALPRIGVKWGVALVGGLFVAYVGVVFINFDKGHILNLLYPLSMLPVLLVSSIVCIILIQQSDDRFVKDLFGRYVSPQVAKEILTMADSSELKLGGETREVSVLFADIRGFTEMSERMSPGEVVGMLNTFLPVVIEKVLENGGMVNKFAGDNIMAVWNAPQSQSDHARLAVKAAWEAQQAVAALSQADPSLPKAQFGIGINSGKVLAGNVGSPGRVEYTVIGDSVNLASRICSVAPGGEVWIGPDTYQQAKEFLEVEAKAPQTLKGKAERVTLYHVTGCQ